MSLALSQEEKKNERIAAGISVAVHLILLLLLIYVMAWRAPGPPAEDIGIELNYGLDNVGSGDIQTMATPNESKNVKDSKPAPTQPDAVREPKPTVQPTPPQPVETPKVQTTTADAPVSVKEEAKPQPKAQPKEEVIVKKEAEKPKALYPGKPTTSSGTGKSGTSDEATGNNNGDNPGTVGDKGSPEGKLDAKALYGKSGGGAGGSLNMAGWGWGDIPKPRDTSSETGKVVIKITINPDGTVENARVVESTVSSQVAEIYRMEVFKKATFVRLGGNDEYGKGATGFITYTIKTR
ncbi:TonB family protein [Pontibacter fetidus]|uniref:TonB family protein n=1 Tax=Pontibacter fetidus TaxID=2700082 RepID=A0A6B2H5E6_9BACT|nr:TonB family protein [Pontibacter fetidus]NDK54342.1 TonB family protein [Pontibacter fetidus]